MASSPCRADQVTPRSSHAGRPPHHRRPQRPRHHRRRRRPRRRSTNSSPTARSRRHPRPPHPRRLRLPLPPRRDPPHPTPHRPRQHHPEAKHHPLHVSRHRRNHRHHHPRRQLLVHQPPPTRPLPAGHPHPRQHQPHHLHRNQPPPRPHPRHRKHPRQHARGHHRHPPPQRRPLDPTPHLRSPTLHTHGHPVDWAPLLRRRATHPSDLPTYPFQRAPALAARPASRSSAPTTAAGPAATDARRTTAVAADRDRRLRSLVPEHAAAVLGHATARASTRGAASRTWVSTRWPPVELRNRLKDATGLRLPATLLFDHPTPEAAGRHLAGLPRSTIAAEPAAARRPRHGRPRRRRPEPIAIVAMACRYPGGVGQPRGAVAARRDRRRRDPPVPRRPRLGPGRALRPGPGRARHALRPRGRLPARRGPRSTPTFFGISPARGARHRPAAAAAAGDVLGGVRAGRHRPGRRCAAAAPASSPARWPTTTAPLHAAAGSGVDGLPAAPAPRTASPPAGSPTRSAWRARRSPSTPPARPRWSPCTWPVRSLRAGECDAGAGRRRRP